MDTMDRSGLFAGLAAYGLWGLLPLFLKALSHLAAEDVLSARVLSSVVFCVVLLLATGRWGATLAALRQPRMAGMLAISTVFIGSNWLIYIIAMNTDHVVEASLGYFINPLLNVVLGVFFLHEKLTRLGWVAIALAVVGVALMTIENGAIPWIALGLAFSFAAYGLVRKHVVINPLSGFAIEALLLLLPATIWVIGWGHIDLKADAMTTALLALTGPVTGIPLMLFAYAARRMPLSVLGLLQYVAPTVVFILGVFLYREPVNTMQICAFAIIWAGLALYVVDSIRQSRRRALAQVVAVR